MKQNDLWVNLSPEETQMVAALQTEMGLKSADEVMHELIRQAHTRVAISCPTCGHAAQRTATDKAQCDSCMSVIQLTDDIWRVITTRP